MRPVPRLMLSFAIAGWLWLADALFLCLQIDCGFLPALFELVPDGRLLVRLIVALTLLFYGVADFIGHTVRRAELTRMNRADGGVLFGDAASKYKSRRLLYYCMRLATMMRLSAKEKDKLRTLCYCYDIGMVTVPLSIREKPGPLTPAEQRERDAHTERGAQIAAAIPRLAPAAELIALHEEFYDGSGVHARVGRSIPLACRIFVTAMLYDYYSQPHGGSPALEKDAALDELRLYRGSLLDPEVLDAFLNIMSDEKLARSVGEKVYIPQ